jgi:hypothetical protein
VLLECASAKPDAGNLSELLRQRVDWPMLFALAEEHGMLGLLARRVSELSEASAPLEFQKKLQERHRAQLLVTLGMTAELFRLLDRLSAAKIGTLVVKGPVLAVRAYGDPALRQYVDLDLLVRDADIHCATKVMIDAGYEADVPLSAIAAGKIPGEYLFIRPGTKLMVELHTERTFRYFPRGLPLEKMFERQINVRLDEHEIPALSLEDELVLICIHGAKHFWERLMWIADVAALVCRQTSIDWERAIAAARDTGAERMLHVGLRLAADLLEMPLPERIRDVVRADRAAEKLGAQIGTWLPAAGSSPPGLLQRAAFRMRMRGGVIAGSAYLLRLSFSPTEEDWVEGAEEKRPWLLDALGRPFRLLRKYGRDGKT